MNLGCNLATFGAVSRAARTARIVADAIAIIRRETGQVAPCVMPTIAPAAKGTSPPPTGAAIWYPREAPLSQVRRKHFAKKTGLYTVHDPMPDGHFDDESPYYHSPVMAAPGRGRVRRRSSDAEAGALDLSWLDDWLSESGIPKCLNAKPG